MSARILAAIVACAFLACGRGAHGASSAYPDYTDLWWTSTESGWGAQVVLQADVIFMTLFVYDGGRRPQFLVASDMRNVAAAGAEPVFSGELFRTSGPSFDSPFDPSQVIPRQVGNATVRFTTPTAARLTYSVDGVTVTKDVTRSTLRAAPLAGDYLGGLFAAAANCTGGTGAASVAYPGAMRVTQTGDQVRIESQFEPNFAATGLCHLSGTLSQQGRIGKIAGSYSCEFIDGPTPVSGTFEISNIEANASGFSGTYVGREGANCVHTGRYGGVRRGYPELPATPDPE